MYTLLLRVLLTPGNRKRTEKKKECIVLLFSFPGFRLVIELLKCPLFHVVATQYSSGGKSPTSTWSGRSTPPYISLHENSCAPFTVPFDFPTGSSNSTPTQ